MAATDFSRIKRSGFTRAIMLCIYTVLCMSSMPTSWFTVFRIPNFSFSTTKTTTTMTTDNVDCDHDTVRERIKS